MLNVIDRSEMLDMNTFYLIT